jgi:Phytanoyl-CoA dioxygenase (PhyH)
VSKPLCLSTNQEGIRMSEVSTLERGSRTLARGELARQFDKDGYVVCRGLFNQTQMQDFIAEIQSFEQKSQKAEPLDQGQMRFYSDIFRKSELIRRFITKRQLIDFLVQVAGPDLWVRWDQAVAKGPHSGVFAWHQDNGYNRLPQQHYQVWIALSEMTQDNGGLWLVPGSHKRHLRHERVANHFEAAGADRYDAPDSGKVFIEAEAGDVVVFSSLTLHKTYENVTANPRWAYVAEVMQLGDFDPTIKPPYFLAAKNGQPVCEFVDTLACSRDPRQIMKTLPLAMRHRIVGPLSRKLRAAFKPQRSPA